jgi:hypothetical protein
MSTFSDIHDALCNTLLQASETAGRMRLRRVVPYAIDAQTAPSDTLPIASVLDVETPQVQIEDGSSYRFVWRPEVLIWCHAAKAEDLTETVGLARSLVYDWVNDAPTIDDDCLSLRIEETIDSGLIPEMDNMGFVVVRVRIVFRESK